MSKVLLDGLYDPNCPLSMLRGVRTEVIGEIVWKEMLVKNWQFFPGKCFVDMCKEGDLEGVRAALQKGTDVNAKDKHGQTGLMVALSSNHNSVVELLLKSPNIDVNQKDNWGSCALHLAASKQNIEALKLLLNVPNIDVNIVDSEGANAVHVAQYVAMTERNVEVLKLLLEVEGINVNCVNNVGWSALRAAAGHWYTEALKLLLNHTSIDVNIVNNDGQSAVHHAVYKNNIKALKLLLDVEDIDVNIVNNDGQSALHTAVMINIDRFHNGLYGREHLAAHSDNIEALNLLLNHPGLTALTLNQKDNKYGQTPVMHAVNHECSSMCLEMLAADLRVDLDTTDKEGRSLEDLAR